ncbi:Nif3-like dinuclear metal center hexameric protein [Nesterenkonia sp. HG001]|uniref:Nif3-like dinuclear metal center hexameric protein n=1 Tax=Nesterenkonia sp. HG001 TaxID=2983207 RepID=UPI002AC5BE0A|nr:Nif3-like dinuclear metal center hexameric protein [Nesterenkonia sp. HG001]MDZ5078399.1 Nif3-like dinuclear metal center hexameric protein [Nesterenkonia sp. HG001]
MAHTSGIGSRTDQPAEDVAAASPVPPHRQTPLLGDVLEIVEELWPVGLAEDWDAVGLVSGRRDRPVELIHFAVDPVRAVVEEACAADADLLITHHPLLLRPVQSVEAGTFKGEIIHRLIESGCALLTAHTNGDSAVGGVNDVLAEILGLEDAEPLSPAPDGLQEEGLGRLGTLPQGTTLGEFAATVFSILPAVAGGVRVAGDRDAFIRRVALCGGAGDGLLQAARDAEADVYITGDLRHHPASEAREAVRDGRPYLIDVSHFASEWLWLPAAAHALDRALTDRGYDVEVAVSGINTDPWDFVITPGR